MPAPIITLLKSPLDDAYIVAQLRELRKNALVESSHFAVASILEFRLPNGSYAYVSGVNIENKEHNRMSSHSEQSAMATAQTLLGGDVKVSKAWVMGAPDQIHQDSSHFLAHKHVSPCGHCRQILLSLSDDNAEVYSVSVNGNVGKADKLTDLLPGAFSERDLGDSSAATSSSSSNVVSLNPSTMHSPKPFFGMSALLQLEDVALGDGNVWHFLHHVRPHVINNDHKTSPIDACIIKVNVDGKSYYVPGALVQDAAFLTTDAVFAAIGMAVTKFGKQFTITDIYLRSCSLQRHQFSATELEHLVRFANGSDVLVRAYKSESEVERCQLSECVTARSQLLLHQLGANQSSAYKSLKR